MPQQHDDGSRISTRQMPRQREPRAGPTEPYGDGSTTAVLLLDVAPSFVRDAQEKLLGLTGVVAVARTHRDNVLRVQLTASDPHHLRTRIDGEIKRVPGVHRCRTLGTATDGSRPGTPMRS